MKGAFLILTLGVPFLLAGCSEPFVAAAATPAAQDMAVPLPPDATAPIAGTEAPMAQQPAASSTLPLVLVHKSPTCGCCTAWVEHMRQAGFSVQVHETEALEPIRQKLGVPSGKGSCHTAEIDGLVVEGHVPADDIKRLLADRGGARGLVVPGMPMGSPGMEMPDGTVPRYTVERVNADGSTTPFATHGE